MEKIARGRFHWCRLVVTYKNGMTLFEDRSDENWWDNLPKKNISSLSVQMTGDLSIKHTIKGSKNHHFFFYHFRRRKIRFGLPDIETMGIGVVVNQHGDCSILEVKEDGSVYSYLTNVVALGVNLEKQGIVLEEIR